MTDTSSEYHAVIINIGTKSISAGFVGEAEPATVLQLGPFEESCERALPPYFELDHSLTALERKNLIQGLTSDPILELLSDIFTREQCLWFPLRSLLKCHSSATLSREVRAKVIDLLANCLLVTPSRTKIFLVDSFITESSRNIIYNELLYGIGVRSIYCIPEPILTIVGANSKLGLVVDIGWDKISIIPVIDLRMVEECGYENFRKSTGTHLHYYTLQKLLELENKELTESLRSNSFEFVNSFVTNCMYCKQDDEEQETQFTLIGIEIPNETRYQPIQECFLSDYVLTKPILRVVERCPLDFRSKLMSSICFTGFVTSIPGFKSSILNQLRELTSMEVQAITTLGPYAGYSLYGSTKLVREEYSAWKAFEVTKRTFVKR